jgi:hypothetical protein
MLASDEASYVSGTRIAVSVLGGILAVIIR